MKSELDHPWGGQVRGMGGTGEEVIGGVDRRAAGRASVGGGTATCSLVVVQCWALSCSQS